MNEAAERHHRHCSQTGTPTITGPANAANETS
jgi:hypothetical protein